MMEYKIADKVTNLMHAREDMNTIIIHSGTGNIFYISRESTIDNNGYSRRAISLGVANETNPDEIKKCYFIGKNDLDLIISFLEDNREYLNDKFSGWKIQKNN